MLSQIITDCCSVSSGTIAALTGEKSYEKIDEIHDRFVGWVAKSSIDFLNWQKAWMHFTKDNPDIPMSYKAWVKTIDRYFRQSYDVRLADLADQPTRDWFDDGIPWQEAVSLIIENEDLPPL